MKREHWDAVRGFWRIVAAGGVPTKDDLDTYGLGEHEASILRNVKAIHRVRATGQRQEARRLAREAAEALAADLDATGWEGPPPAVPEYTGVDPVELAARVPRR